MLGPFFWLPESRWLQNGFQRSQDGSKTTLGASRTPLIRLQDRPSTSQDAYKTAQDAPKALQEPPRRLSEPPRILQELSKSSPGELFEAPSRLQELSGGAFQASSCCPATSSLWPAGGLGGMREASTINEYRTSDRMRRTGKSSKDQGEKHPKQSMRCIEC